jgi:hypothetical protein
VTASKALERLRRARISLGSGPLASVTIRTFAPASYQPGARLDQIQLVAYGEHARPDADRCREADRIIMFDMDFVAEAEPR